MGTIHLTNVLCSSLIYSKYTINVIIILIPVMLSIKLEDICYMNRNICKS